MNRAFWLDLVQRVGVAAAIAFVGSLVANEVTGVTVSTLHAAEIAASAAALRTLLGLLSTVYGAPDSAALISKKKAPTKPKVAVIRERGGRGPLGRHIEHDERSRAYAVVPSKHAGDAVRHVRRAPIFNQGDVGSCTGNAMAGWLGTDHDGSRGDKTVRETDAVKLYTLATKLDAIPGTYPQTDTGSTGLAVAKAAKQLGLITGYQHAFSIPQALTALLDGPLIVGTDWLDGMDNPDASGLVHATGSVRGGHEYEVIGYDPAAGLVECCNSWGRSWGHYGRFFLSLDDLTRLLKAGGDVTVPRT